MARPPRRAAAAAAIAQTKQMEVEGEESEWDESDSQDDHDDDDDEDKEGEDLNVGDVKDKARKVHNNADDCKSKLTNVQEKKKPTRKRKTKSNGNDCSDEEHLLPTSLRKTSRGGYAHTMRSRARISKANSGKVPWNKGRQWSEANKAKIAAAVRARNKAILTEKLKMFNMTEDEFRAKQKEIKYLRERVRRAKLDSQGTARQMDADELSLQVKLDEAVALRDRVVKSQIKPSEKKANEKKDKQDVIEGMTVKEEDGLITSNQLETSKRLSVAREEFEQREDTEVNCDKVTRNEEDASDSHVSAPDHVDNNADDNKTIKSPKKPKTTKIDPLSMLPIMTWKMVWTPHEFDHAPPSCPNGGPSGLVCCDACSLEYSRFMSRIVEDMESQRMEEVAIRVEELLVYIEETRMQLLVATQAARKMIAPRSLPPIIIAKRDRMKASNLERAPPDSSVMDWCVTSTLDMGNWGQTTIRS